MGGGGLAIGKNGPRVSLYKNTVEWLNLKTDFGRGTI